MNSTYPLLPLRDIVVFPGMVVPLFVGREKSVAALEAAMAGGKDIVLLSQLDPGCDDPAEGDLYDTGVIAQVLQQLHSVPPNAPLDGLMPLECWFGALFRQAAADRLAGRETIYLRAAALAGRLLAGQRQVRVLHGDIHHRNIRQSPRGWLAFDPKGLVGERTYDCANTLCNPEMPALVHNETRLLTQAGILADALDIHLPRLLAFTYAYACLNASWWLGAPGAEDMVDWSLKVAAIIEPHLPRM